MTTLSEQDIVLQTWILENESQLAEWAGSFSRHIKTPMVVLLDGTMGSGKTTLMRYLMRELGGGQANSPTFSLVNEYRYPGGIIYHFDLYRLEGQDELEEIGFEEYITSDAICFIEWPELGRSYYDNHVTSTIRIEIIPEGRRTIQWFKGIAL